MRLYKLSYAAVLLHIIISFSCRSDKLRYPEEKATVLGKEVCQQDVTKDYWLVNFDKGYGDTLTYKGVFYKHVTKTNQLDPLLKKAGMRVFLEFDISTDKINSTDCNYPSVEIYSLKVLQLRSQSEQR